MNKSEELKNNFKGKLKLLLADTDEIYYSIRNELEREILNKKETIEKIESETNEIYEILTVEICEDLIKSKLPLRVKLFNKIKYCSKGVRSNNHILIGFFINDSYNCFNYVFTISEIKEFIKKL